MTHLFETREDPDINSVWQWFEFQLGLIHEEQGRKLRILASGAEIDVGPPGAHESPFIGLGPREVEEFSMNRQATWSCLLCSSYLPPQRRS